MGRRELLWTVWTGVILTLGDLNAGVAAEPPILPAWPDIPHLGSFQQRAETADPRSRLSTTQQHQILSDVQQHQKRYNQPSSNNPASYVTFPSHDFSLKSKLLDQSNFPSLAKYRVDRTKQQQKQPETDTRNFGQIFPSQFSSAPNEQLIDYHNDRSEKSQSIFENENKLRLDEYYEKQRQLELIKKQREQLILEQQEIKRQQEFLRLQQLRQLTSTTSSPTINPTTRPTNYVTTSAPILLASPTARRITTAESDLFLKAIATHQRKFTTTTTTTTTSKPPSTKVLPITKSDHQEIPKDILSLIQAQQPQLLSKNNKSQIKIIYQTEKASTGTSGGKSSETTLSNTSDNLVKQLKLALAQSADKTEKNITTRELLLPNGKKLQVIQAPNGLSSIVPNDGTSQFQTVTQALESPASSTTTTTTIRPAKAILDELTKGVLPPGANFQVLRHKDDGKLEDIGKSPLNPQPGKKVTFVVLEEQPDGSYRVQGVRGNAEKDNSGPDVDSIVEKIKKGEIKLPARNPTVPTNAASSSTPVFAKISSTTPRTTLSTRPKETTTVPSTFRPTTIKYSSLPITSPHSSSPGDYIPRVTVSPNSISPSDNYVTSASTTNSHVYNSILNIGSSTTREPTLRYVDHSSQLSASTASPTFSTTFIPRTSSSYSNYRTTTRPPVTDTIPNYSISSASTSENLILNDFQQSTSVPDFFDNNPNAIALEQPQQRETITNLLRREGLFAMAKYLRQSGLDTVLNETGPYTIFVPTDKAFRTLLVQLGGPDKAEIKFKENPRLLSGLLLHHVIPGAFRMDSLQDEMTGVSLAGTQLRVNVYDMHDHEWNDVKVTTINGAKVAPNKRDIEIPQGIAHAVDRVMFPLPVGDLTQTLQADRERRFVTFLKILRASGMEETLAGTKTFTVFAPTDAAFANAASQNGRPVWTDSDGQEAAKDIISRHIIPTTLYTSGMRYYHQKDTLRPQMSLSIYKNGGRVRVNDAQVVTHNVPATNGVIHAIDAIL